MGKAWLRIAAGGLALALAQGFAFGALAQTPEAAPEPEPRFVAFQDICIDARQSFDAMAAAAATHGWAVSPEDARPELARVMAQARAYTERGIPVRRTSLYSRVLTGSERAFLLFTELDNNGATLISCALYAFDAPEPVPGQLVRNWVGFPAEDWGENPDGSIAQRWLNPPSMPGVAVFRHIYLKRAADAPPENVSGMMLSLIGVPAAAAPPEG